jgi:hypothetical protein
MEMQRLEGGYDGRVCRDENEGGKGSVRRTYQAKQGMEYQKEYAPEKREERGDWPGMLSEKKRGLSPER